MRRYLIALFLFAVGSPVAADAWTPDEQMISKVESAIQIPDWGRSTMYPNGHAPAVTEFARYYAGGISNGHRTVYGELIGLQINQQTSVHLVDGPNALPFTADGGCHIVHIVYDVDVARIVSLKCNGFG